jgi:hypothetical protein
MMLHPIIEEVWTSGTDPKPVRRPRIKDARDGWNAAYERAMELAASFDESDFVHGERYSYAWGRNRDARETYRYVVK